MPRLNVCVIIACLVGSLQASALDLSGSCSGTIPAAGSPHQLVGNCTVPAGQSLTFEVGSSLEGNGFFLSVDGALELNGASFDDVATTVRDGGTATIDQSAITGESFIFDSGSGGSITDSSFDITGGAFFDLLSISSSITVSGSTITTNGNPAIQVNAGSPTLDDNDFDTGNATSIVVSTGATPQITNSRFPGPGLGTGIEFESGGGGSVDGNTFTREGSSPVILVRGDASPTITNNTLDLGDTPLTNIGIDLDVSTASAISMTANDFCVDTNDLPFSISANFFASSSNATVNNNTFSCGSGAGVGLSSQNLDESATLASIEGISQFVGSGTLRVPGGFTLTVPAGLTIASGLIQVVGGTFDTSEANFDGVRFQITSGSLTADQVSMTDIIIEYFAGSGGSLTDSQIEGTVFVAGDVTVSGNTMNVGGGLLALTIGGGSPIVDNNIFGSGMEVTSNAVAPEITNNLIEAFGVGLEYAFGTSASGNVSGNTFRPLGSFGSAVVLEGDAAPTITNNTVDLTSSNLGNTAFDLDFSSNLGLSITNNEICADENDIIFEVDFNFFGSSSQALIDSNTLTCLPGMGVSVVGEPDENLTLTELDGISDFRFDGFTTIGSGRVLTVSNGLSIGGGGQVVIDGSGIFGSGLFDLSFVVRDQGTLNATGSSFTISGGFPPSTLFEFQPGSAGSIVDSKITRFRDVFVGIASDDVTISNTTFVSTLRGTGVTVQDSSPTIEDNTFEGVATMLSIDGNAAPVVTGNSAIGDANGPGLMLNLSSGTPTFEGNHLENFETGIEFQGVGDFTFTNQVLACNEIALDFVSTGVTATLIDSVFDGNNFGLQLSSSDEFFNLPVTGFDTSTFAGPIAKNFVKAPASFSQTGVLPAQPVAYATLSNLTFEAGSAITLPAGFVLAAGGFDQVIVEDGADLVVAGSSTQPVVFSNNPTNTIPWRGMIVRGDDASLSQCIVENASQNGIHIDNAAVTVTDCRVTGNGANGIEITGTAAPMLSGNVITDNIFDGVRVGLSAPPASVLAVEDGSIFGNTGFGINNLSAEFDVMATNNYWGDDTGPSDLSDDRDSGGLYNIDGRGQSVSDQVFYDPWTRIGPSVEGTISVLSGNDQSGPLGSTLAAPLVVEVLSVLGTPLQDIEVRFQVTEGEASVVEAQPLLTGVNGRVTVTIQLGLIEGPVSIAAAARDVNSPLAVFQATSTNGPGLVAHGVNLDVQPGVVGQTGDVNGDGNVDIVDAAVIKGLVAGVLGEHDLAFFSAADTNADGLIDDGDALVLLGYQVGRLQ